MQQSECKVSTIKLKELLVA